jgi:hypothetical protein
MGQATDLDNFLDMHPLTQAETSERRKAEEISDPDVEVTPGGDLAKRQQPAAAPTIIQQRQTRTWD